VFQGGIDSRIPGRTVAHESLSVKSPVIGVAIPGRIMGYDVARAIAVMGMVIVNYNNIFFVGRTRDPQWFTVSASFMLGRAAAVFVMLAGVGITLMSQKAILSEDLLLIQRVRRNLLKRSLFLFFAGLVFLNWWKADILHFYGLYLYAASLLLLVPGRRIWILIGGCLAAAGSLFILYEADPVLVQVLLPSSRLLALCDTMLISGQYPVLPWFAFLMAGIWLGRSEIISNRRLVRRIFVAALPVFLLTVVLDKNSDFILQNFTVSGNESPMALLLLSVPFPISPVFAISAMASSLMVIIGCINFCSNPLLARPLSRLAAVGKMSLSVYIGHICLGLAVEHYAFSRLDLTVYRLVVVGFTLLFCLAVYWGANLWLRHFERGPLEWLLRRL